MSRAGVLLLIVGVAAATTGFDTIQRLSSATFECLAKNDYQFFIARVHESTGNYDEAGIANIKNARAAGWSGIGGYFVPCLSNVCPDPEAQISTTITRLRNGGASVDMLWLDIEVFMWSPFQAINRQFIQRMADRLDFLKVNWGIYTNNYNWATVTGDWDQFAEKKLWWANFDGNEDYSGFKPFGGWTKPSIHQFTGNVQGPCSVSLNQNCGNAHFLHDSYHSLQALSFFELSEKLTVSMVCRSYTAIELLFGLFFEEQFHVEECFSDYSKIRKYYIRNWKAANWKQT